MPQFHETIYGKRFFDSQLPQLIKQLEFIGNELKRVNDTKEPRNFSRLADDVARYDYRIAQIFDVLLNND